ncbi:AraC family transcriptional regulator [Granulicella sp. dw_53]|uniref:helix-turn-helix domain-containing protein n=1 Tax=Granulicella sp. dw_53 TaxID=2719792 RepID=UPI001BD5FD10|nr:AraC family transcriptional regulator [Granulicella sp. dw_53]
MAITSTSCDIPASLKALTGPESSVVSSSNSLSWGKFLLERHRVPPGEREHFILGCHVLWVSTKLNKGEYAGDGGRVVPFTKPSGSLTVTPIGHFPTWRSPDNLEFMLLGFDNNFMANVGQELDRPIPELYLRTGFQDSAIRRLMALLREEFELGTPSSSLYVESLAHTIAVRYLTLNLRSPVSPNSALTTALPRPALKRVMERIEEGLSSNLTLQSLAEETGYSRGHFISMFRAATNLTPHQYLVKRRIARVKSLLEKKDKSLIDIAMTCGFSSQSHMTQVFRAQTGVSPGEYRRFKSSDRGADREFARTSLRLT